MDISESFPGHSGDNGRVKNELSQKEREAKQERWSELHYKLIQAENLTSEEKEKIEAEKEELRKQIT